MRLPNISTRELRNFVQLAASRSLKDAAEACALSQPALSLQLKQLEQKVGAKLVVRNSAQRRIELTPAGTELLQAAGHALQILHEAVERISPTPSSDKPLLRVACLPSLLRDMISPIIGDLVKAYPNAQISVLDCDSATCSTLLSSKKCEVAVCSRPVYGHDIKSQCLLAERFYAVMDRSDPRASLTQLTLDDFAGTTVVNLADNHSVRNSLLSRSIPSIHVNTITALEGLLIQQVGVAIVANSAADLIEQPALVKRPLVDGELRRQIFQSWSASQDNRIVAEFVRRLSERAAPGM
jgi:DNA-binding transcriptional LysR family regulator